MNVQTLDVFVKRFKDYKELSKRCEFIPLNCRFKISRDDWLKLFKPEEKLLALLFYSLKLTNPRIPTYAE